MRVWIKLGVVAVALLLGACKSNQTIYALTATGSLIEFDTSDPTSLNNQVSVSGLDTDESLVQICFRPSTGVLYGLSSNNRVVTIDTSTGTVSPVASSGFTSDTLASPIIGIDPVVDSMRVIATDVNDRVNLGAGTLDATATAVAYDSGDTNDGSTPALAALAYDNPAAGATSTTLFALDVTTQSLVRVGSSGVNTTSTTDEGLLHTIGKLGVSFSSSAGFAITSDGKDAYAVLKTSGAASKLYTIDLGGGGASLIDTVGGGDLTLISLAIAP